MVPLNGRRRTDDKVKIWGTIEMSARVPLRTMTTTEIRGNSIRLPTAIIPEALIGTRSEEPLGDDAICGLTPSTKSTFAREGNYFFMGDASTNNSGLRDIQGLRTPRKFAMYKGPLERFQE